MNWIRINDEWINLEKFDTIKFWKSQDDKGNFSKRNISFCNGAEGVIYTDYVTKDFCDWVLLTPDEFEILKDWLFEKFEAYVII